MHTTDPTLRPPHVKIYAAIAEYWREYGRSPSQMELRDATLYSITTVVAVLKDLKRKGFITNTKFGTRSIQLTDWERTLGSKEMDPWESLSQVKFFKPNEEWEP